VSRLRNPGFDCPKRRERGEGANLEPIKTKAKTGILFSYILFPINRKIWIGIGKKIKKGNKFATYNY
jgi:hypothetical protein